MVTCWCREDIGVLKKGKMKMAPKMKSNHKEPWERDKMASEVELETKTPRKKNLSLQGPLYPKF